MGTNLVWSFIMWIIGVLKGEKLLDREKLMFLYIYI